VCKLKNIKPGMVYQESEVDENTHYKLVKGCLYKGEGSTTAN
jgi:hypothetical protein